MADDGKGQSTNVWPLVKFSFRVTIGSSEILFQEVTGLSSEAQNIEYRSGNSKIYPRINMPGIKKYSNVTLKKGIFKSDKEMWSLYNEVKMNTTARQTITISLLDEKQDVAMSWTLTNACPVKMTVTDMKADANEAAVETMELVHEGLAVSVS